MRRTLIALTALVGGLWSFPAIALTVPKLFEASGTVSLADGVSPGNVSVELRIDLTRDGDFSKYETATAKTTADGSWTVTVKPDPGSVGLSDISDLSDLVNKFNEEGFEGLLAGRPMRGTIRFSKRGYSTVVKNFNVQAGDLDLSAVLAPLSPLGCSEEGCRTALGDLSFVGLDPAMGIAEATGRAYDPTLDRSRFPGSFAEASGDSLISSGFMELDLRDKNGDPITKVDEPLLVRWKIDPVSWPTLVDATPGNGRVDLQLYSFDAASGSWTAESTGWLEREDGSEVAEGELADVIAGKTPGPLFVAAELSHFSYWNVDRPVEHQSCVRGRVVNTAGKPIAGIQVTGIGVSYSGESLSISTDAQGQFVASFMKSENPGQDVDGNGKSGERFTARLLMKFQGKVSLGAPFETPLEAGKIVEFYEYTCAPAKCPCVDVGDVTFTPVVPKACRIQVTVRSSGKSAVLWGGSGEADPKGTALSGVSLYGEADVGVTLDLTSVPECASGKCGSATTAADGSVELVVPTVDGASVSVTADGASYSGEASLLDCASGTATLTVEADYYSWDSISDFSFATWGGSTSSGADAGSLCGCSKSDDDVAQGGAGGALLLLALLALRGARRA